MSPLAVSNGAPRRAAPLAPIIAGLCRVMTVASIVAEVNQACGVDPDQEDPDLWQRTYSWSEIYTELRAQGFVSAVAYHRAVQGALFSNNPIAVFRPPFSREVTA